MAQPFNAQDKPSKLRVACIAGALLFGGLFWVYGTTMPGYPAWAWMVGAGGTAVYAVLVSMFVEATWEDDTAERTAGRACGQMAITALVPLLTGASLFDALTR